MSRSVAMCCGIKSATTDSRPRADGTWRRNRKCEVCGRRWSTLEVLRDGNPILSVAAMERLEALQAKAWALGAEIHALLTEVTEGAEPIADGRMKSRRALIEQRLEEASK